LQKATTGSTEWRITEWTIVTNDIWLDPTCPAWCCLRPHCTEPGAGFGKPIYLVKWWTCGEWPCHILWTTKQRQWHHI